MGGIFIIAWYLKASFINSFLIKYTIAAAGTDKSKNITPFIKISLTLSKKV